MSAATLLAVLRKHPFVEDFRPEHIEKLRSMAREADFAADQTIFREGDDFHDFCLIVSGRVALEMEEPDHVLRVQTLSKYFKARTLEAVHALAFDGPALLEACRADPAFGFAMMYRMLGVVSERLQATRLQLHDMHSRVAKRAGN